MSDFRQYLEALEKAGQLVHVTKDVSPEFEVAAYVRKSSDTDGPAFVFEHVTGHPGWRLAAGLYGTMARSVTIRISTLAQQAREHWPSKNTTRLKQAACVAAGTFSAAPGWQRRGGAASPERCPRAW